ncbi:hypothetical protein [Neisseria sp.]|uniref:hypothetical protein n=1 Tax=Neisseria sp. TaxID=192066 RepID=UPI0035A17D90
MGFASLQGRLKGAGYPEKAGPSEAGGTVSAANAAECGQKVKPSENNGFWVATKCFQTASGQRSGFAD